MALWVDDQMSFAAPTMAAGNAAMGAWVRMSAWSSAQLADGRVPRAVAHAMASARELAQLVSVGLLADEGDLYRIVDYLALNPTREQVQAERATRRASAQTAARVRWGREPQASTHPSTHADGSHAPMRPASVDASNTQSPLPIPSHPIPREPLALTRDDRTTKRAKREATPQHREVVTHFVALYEQLRGCKPELTAKDHAAANRLLANGRTADEARTILDRAFATDFVRTEKPDLAYIASNVNAYLGTAPARVSRNGHQAVPTGGSIWQSALDAEEGGVQ